MLPTEDLCDRAGAVDGGTVRSAQRNALCCALILGACVAVVHPVGREGYLDDFSYAATALDFLRTGHVIYNNWTAPTEGWMIAWGALFIKFFGFSPVIQPEYYVVVSPSYCLQPSRFPPIPYRAWLRPFRRSESIEQPIYARR